MSTPPAQAPAHYAMVVDDPPAEIEPGEHAGPNRPPRPRQGGRGRYHRGRGGRYNPPPQREQDSNALGAFTRFFRAEAQAKELATRKEAHAFDELLRNERLRNERLRNFVPYRAPRGRNLTLGHRPSSSPAPRESARRPQQPRPSTARRAPATAAQVIAEVSRNTTAILAPPPTPVIPVPDPGPDVEEIIAAAEQLDLERARNLPDVTTEDVLGRCALIYLVVAHSLLLIGFLAAFASI
ncbi:hypothetical protein C8R48DRAFT_670883 [Suillus tomentosus]|nr:hypothetical protein C8R48DRAFT_670883 [Suillus tomentosus]